MIENKGRFIREIVRDLEREHGPEVPLEAVYEIAEEGGMKREDAEELILAMKRDGLFYSPSKDVIKWV